MIYSSMSNDVVEARLEVARWMLARYDGTTGSIQRSYRRNGANQQGATKVLKHLSNL
jgi:hypothetical protein